jgi:thiol-disulfide isomerase/thioredoxin
MKLIYTALFFLFSFSLYADDLYVFTATWCPPCKELKRFMANNPEVFKDYEVSIIDIDDYPEIAKSYNVDKVPTSVILENGEVSRKYIGFSSGYKNWIEKKSNERLMYNTY